MIKNFNAPDWEKYIPEPVFDERPDYLEIYKKAWDLARDHVREIPGMPQTPYMDEAFCDTQIWIWDTCFMSLFCKFAPEVFPGVESLRNFYEVFYGGGSLPEIIPGENEPAWTGNLPGKKAQIKVCIADNPPLFAWAEYENALVHGDVEYIRDLLCNKQFLQKHYEWIEGLCEQTQKIGTRSKTWLMHCELGYKWEGGRSGMDNTPRGRTTPHALAPRPNNPDMLWIDAICQQALSAKMIAKLFALIGDGEGEREWNSRYLEKKNIVNRYYWDEGDKFFYDIDCNTREHYKVMSVASYWALTAEIADETGARAMAERIYDERSFGGTPPLVSLSRSDNDFLDDGKYWRGSMWLPTAYAALKGFAAYGFFGMASNAARRILDHMIDTYNSFEPHTIWECYSPSAPMPGTDPDDKGFSKPDFCGWSALGPISMLIEYIIGFHNINAFEKKVEWAMPEGTEGKIGIKNLRFGDVVTDIVAEGDSCTVRSNESYTLVINGKCFEILPGENSIPL